MSASGSSQGYASITLLDAQEEPTAMLPMRLNEDALSDLVVCASGYAAPRLLMTSPQVFFMVTNANDSGPGSFRQAIINANNSPGADTIRFNIPESGVPSITLLSVLPTLTEMTTVDGTTQQPAGRVELNGTNAGNGITGLSIGGGNSTIRGLVINRFTDNGVGIGISGRNVIEGNFIGTNSAGTAASGNAGFGIFIVGVPGNTIGGTSAPGRNIISASGLDGVIISSAAGNTIQGNLIGTDIAGTADIGNSRLGVFVADGVNTTIGGTAAGARNVISGNDSFGVQMQGGSSELTLLQGNFIGTDITGTVQLGNTAGIFIISEKSHSVGGTTPAARNIISGNKGVGITIEASIIGNRVQGNYIGTTADGSSALSNLGDGMLVTLAAANVIGGAADGAPNVISGNSNGIGLGFLTPSGKTGGGDCTIQGNYIGTDATGTKAIGNRLFGIFVNVDSVAHRILNNLIAFNGGGGVRIPDETSQLGVPGFRITIQSNGIFSNGALGIDLGPPGVTPNEPVNPVPRKANERQNFPVLTSAGLVSSTAVTSAGVAPASVVTVSGSLHSIPSSTFSVEFFFCTVPCSASAPQFVGCIPIFLGTRAVITNANGDAKFSFPFELPGTATTGYVNATAANPGGSTSEFSQCIQVGTPGPVITRACKGDGKQLIINGSGFVDGAKVLINVDVEKKTRFVSSTQVIALKAGKRTFAGDKLKVRNPDGGESPELTYTQVDCPP